MIEHLPGTSKALGSIPSSVEDQIKTKQRLRGSSLVELLPAMHKALSPIPSTAKET